MKAPDAYEWFEGSMELVVAVTGLSSPVAEEAVRKIVNQAVGLTLNELFITTDDKASFDRYSFDKGLNPQDIKKRDLFNGDSIVCYLDFAGFSDCLDLKEMQSLFADILKSRLKDLWTEYRANTDISVDVFAKSISHTSPEDMEDILDSYFYEHSVLGENIADQRADRDISRFGDDGAFWTDNDDHEL